ncbi:hypothetical protein ACFSTC_47920 [Nonomuraea ferruginea]
MDRHPPAWSPGPPAHWGLAARGALVESGGPAVRFDFDRKETVWSELAPKLYLQAVARQWDPVAAVDWDTPFELPAEIEAAVVQVMTYLVENEQAALVIPARLLARVHPHFREVMQLLAVQAADEARHVEVFTRRATLKGEELGTSSAAWARLPDDAAGRARLLPRLVPAVGARRGQLPQPAVLPRPVRARPGHAADRGPGPPGRGPSRGLRHRSPGGAGPRRSRLPGHAQRSDRAAARRAGRHRRHQRGRARRPDRAGSR